MRHHNTNRKFSRTKDVRVAFVRSLAKNLIAHEAIETTEARAKEIRPFVEKLVTKSKVDSVANRRHVMATLGNATPETKKLFETLGPRYKERAGGYLRIIKTRVRGGDGAVMAHISFV